MNVVWVLSGYAVIVAVTLPAVKRAGSRSLAVAYAASVACGLVLSLLMAAGVTLPPSLEIIGRWMESAGISY